MTAEPFATPDEAAEAVLTLLRERVPDQHPDSARVEWPGTVKRRRMRDALLLALGQTDPTLRPLLTAYGEADRGGEAALVCAFEEAAGALARDLWAENDPEAWACRAYHEREDAA